MAFAAKLQKLRADVNAAVDLCNGLGGKAEKAKSAAVPTPLPELLENVVDACRAHRKRKREADDYGRVGDEEIVALSRHTENYALSPYSKFLWYVPRLVNVVSLAEAVPAEGSGVTLPLDLRTIAARCRGAFYAPARFAAVQLAFSQPRSRILIFHTGRLVGTGTTGHAAARAAIVRAQRQLALEAGVRLNIQSFQVINTVGAVSLRASLNCDAFASAHSSDAHYDKASFVGLAWRPPRESLCCEIYSTGKGKCVWQTFPCGANPMLTFPFRPQSPRLRRPAPAPRQLLAHASRCRAAAPSTCPSEISASFSPHQSCSASRRATPCCPKFPRSCSASTAKTRSQPPKTRPRPL
jgi:TATA-box binding protein (TBP) (component of TFIID and TFIIIB)